MFLYHSAVTVLLPKIVTDMKREDSEMIAVGPSVCEPKSAVRRAAVGQDGPPKALPGDDGVSHPPVGCAVAPSPLRGITRATLLSIHHNSLPILFPLGLLPVTDSD